MGKTVRAWRSMLCGFFTVKTDAALRDASFTEDMPQPCSGILSFDSAWSLLLLVTGCSVVDPTSTGWFGWVELTMGIEPFPLDSLNSLRRS